MRDEVLTATLLSVDNSMKGLYDSMKDQEISFKALKGEFGTVIEETESIQPIMDQYQEQIIEMKTGITMIMAATIEN